MPEIDPTRSIKEFFVFHMIRLRTEARMSQAQLAAAIPVSASLIGHIENLVRKPTMTVAKGLDRVFDLDIFFVGLIPRVQEESGLGVAFAKYTDEEARADEISIYTQWVFHGIVQCEAYARTVLRAGNHADQLDGKVAERLSRQDRFSENPPYLNLIIAEAALRNLVGGPEVMRSQLEHILELATHPKFNVWVVPAGSTVYPESSFTLLGFDNDPTIGYIDGAGGHGEFVEAGSGVTRLNGLYNMIRTAALPTEDSLQMIRAMLENM
ncbi:helix-turn-helix transcriptional regulator [Actinocorallia sp. API 0066]|uniref:helix-turn-helix domain-containing protein n=1 Tax=Actinocorallia sp. API 0066 TaxID=2896846 RepID=UPI001E4351F8|nr:helix-turn-helix transcriptional regulator [Actinocorallia sp. API 0066]MCD0447808.1 helix-turn-helix transcriptional regulator [Actinocorallia sp. API 0066]